MHIAVDAAGGDHAPKHIVAGALVAARHLGCGLTLVGPRDQIESELERHGGATGVDLRTIHAPDVVAMDAAPAAALRRQPRASVRVAADTVAAGDAVAFFSAGNTGATVMSAHAAFGMLPGVDRPALAATIPTLHRDAVLLDAGATVDCRAHHLVQFAAMGTVYARTALSVASPRVGLLSTGEEATKGNDLTRDAHQRLRACGVNFIGNIEARDVYGGRADVIVCDGFTGNVALKISEGLVEVVEDLLRAELRRSRPDLGICCPVARSGASVAASTIRSTGGRPSSAWRGWPLSGMDGHRPKPCATPSRSPTGLRRRTSSRIWAPVWRR